MPTEYIKRQAALNIVCSDDCVDCPDGGCDLYRRMKKVPAADVRPVVRGKWIDKPNPQWRAYDIRHCSSCGWSIHKTKLRVSDLNWNFCPNCGADMREVTADG